MPAPLTAKFINQIDYLARQLFSVLEEHPYAVQSELNVLLHQFEGLALHVNHFGEKNDCEVQFSQSFRDLANSIKHNRSAQPNQIKLKSTVMFESTEEGFRFIRNTILADYPDGELFDAIEELCAAIGVYLPIVKFAGPNLKIPENESYPFYEHAVVYHRDDLSAYTKEIIFTTMRKKDGRWASVDPGRIGFIALDKSEIGKDPTPYFQKNSPV